MTAEKCFALYFPLNARYLCTVRSAQWTTLVMVIIFFLYNSQLFVVIKKSTDDLGNVYCETAHVPENYVKTFHVIHAVIYSYIPIVSMALLNVAICMKLRQSAKVNVALVSTGTGNENWVKAARQGTKMLLTVSCTFITLTTPVCIYFNIADDPLTYSPIAFSVTLNLQWANHSINVLLYTLIGSTYRKAVRKMLQCRKSNRIASDSGNTSDNNTGFSTVGTGSATGSATGKTSVHNLQVPGRRPVNVH